MKNKYLAGIGANVFLLGLVSFFNDLSSEMIMPILPIFITALGGTGLVVGLVGGVRDSISSILQVICGHWSDKIGKRKIFVTAGYFNSAVFKLFLAFSKTWQHILVFSGLERIGKGMRTAPRDAIIADSMPKEKGKGFGIHRTLDTSGAILGSFLVFILFRFLYFDFKSIIIIAALIAFISLIPLYFVREKKRKSKEISVKIGIKKLPFSLRLFILISGLFALANFSYMFFILKVQQSFTGKTSVALPILLYILFNVFYALFAVPFGILSDRIGRKRVLIFGYFLFSLTSLGFVFYNSILAFVGLFVLYGIMYAIIDGNQRAYVSDLSTEKLRATALGTFHTVIGLMALPSSLIAGLLWQIDSKFTFVYGFLLGLVSVALFLGFGSIIEDRKAL